MPSTAQNQPSVPHPLEGEHVPQGDELEHIAGLFEQMINESSHPDHPEKLRPLADGHGALTPGAASTHAHGKWWKKFWPDHLEERLDKLFNQHHMGNYVAIRAQNGRPQTEVFESMPIYVRVGMHLLFSSSQDKSLLRYKSIEELLKSSSIRQGRVYDDSSNPKAVLEHIQSFIATYSLDTSELLNPDPASYTCFNEFFYRKLKPGARPIANHENDRVISSAADCRMTVFSSVDEAKEIWVKGKKFTIGNLLDDQKLADEVFTPGSDVVIFRLAPADYHRWHSAVGPAVVGATKQLAGEYYTVNPQAVNEDFNVFTANKRDVMIMTWKPSGLQPIPVASVHVGAMLVGSIGYDVAQGTNVQRGDSIGYFAYGGSTVIHIFPPQAKIKWDDDILANSRKNLETMVRVGDHMGEVQN
ncbi:hypothetical protein K437DRAFT_252999 [Tilletiaria anomala UBC 951]|uniref:Phosphatidylserine decarboxylase n=1 Tax=Tilletiaria anomala (strain ATCC 24038 / CBS 436.72 / UBC 951) TaxID=1037660 RepID=A0A066WHY7_TILAU|nr:uncharacterized protein K437DRAFT_252999 [Tilletiaria anomala UBC 951]KDN53632.1 hypothetical protein K437DRAFT_252999 [Tilletiaria anomala UBC 951]